ncbi:hypothetical protein D9M68_494690 [compost metagenome]
MTEKLLGHLFDNAPDDGLHAAERLTEDIQAHQKAIIDALVNGVGIHQVPDQNLVGLLTQPIDPTNPLFDLHRIPGQVVIHQQRRELQVDALRTDLGRQQNLGPRIGFERPQYCVFVIAPLKNDAGDTVLA